MSKREAYLWTTGYVPRQRTYPGFETPKPVMIDVNKGEADLKAVIQDVLALTKVNYNACDYASGLPVTLKFADRVGEILTASPRGMQAPPLPFRYYI
jgi:argonaute-like protein implicated in RNA metabolism and viral defense